MPLPSLSLLKGFGLPLLVILAVAGYSGVVFYIGYDYSAKKTKAAVAEDYKRDLADIRMRWIEDRVLLSDLQTRLTQDVSKIRTITKEVPVYVEPEKDQFCSPSVGIVGLLNSARNPNVPFAPGEPDAESRTPSGISYTEQVTDTLGVTERYNELMLRHNALLEWIEDNYGPAEQSRFRGSLE